MTINPKKHSAADLIGLIDELTFDQLLELKGAELEARGRKTVLAAIDAAVEAHEDLAAELDEIIEESSAAVVPVAMSVTFMRDRRGWFAGHPGVPGFDALRFGSEGACRGALSARLLG